MAETESTRAAAGERRPDHDDAGAGLGTDGASSAVGDDRSAGPGADDAPSAGRRPGTTDASGSDSGGIAQRHTLPMRRASTMPDVPGILDGEAERERASGMPAPDDAPAMEASPSTAVTPTVDPAGQGTSSDDASREGAPADDRHTAGGNGLAPTAAGSMPGSMAGPMAGASTASGSSAIGSPATGSSAAGQAVSGSSDTVRASTAAAQPAPDDSPDGRELHPSGAEPTTDTGALSVRPPDKDVARRAAVRDQAVSAKPALPRFLQVVVALFFPVIVVAAAVRAVATSSFLWLEYNRPGFPADQYGFSLDDRMTYGSYALDYVLNFAPPRYLGGLVTPEGEPLFLESEVGHMADVKGVLGLSFFIALVMFVLAVVACVYLARRYKGGIRRALFSGAVLTLVGIVVLTVLAVIGWQTFFTQVHALFFADGTWTFRVDDTLIRLFPEQFWTDSAVTIAVLVLAATILTLVATWPTKARRDRSMLAQDAAQARYREALEKS